MNSIFDRWQSFCERRDCSLKKSGRTSSELSVVAVSKKQSAQIILEHLMAIPEFPRTLGENYLQELQQKTLDTSLSEQSIEWHFIGSIQSKKIPQICHLASVIHSVGRLKELEALSTQLLKLERIPNFFVQFNVSGEISKNGFEPTEARQVQEAIEKLGLQKYFLGLMCSAAPLDEVGPGVVIDSFLRLNKVRDECFKGSKLSMGMSDDFDLAIEAGSDVIRVGSVLFGQRLSNNTL